jgi:hypothetical protein
MKSSSKITPTTPSYFSLADCIVEASLADCMVEEIVDLINRAHSHWPRDLDLAPLGKRASFTQWKWVAIQTLHASNSMDGSASQTLMILEK